MDILGGSHHILWILLAGYTLSAVKVEVGCEDTVQKLKGDQALILMSAALGLDNF